jgi:hypothetical protein
MEVKPPEVHDPVSNRTLTAQSATEAGIAEPFRYPNA